MKKTDEQLQQEVAEIRRFVDGNSRDKSMKPLKAYDEDRGEHWCSCPNCYAGICWEHRAAYVFYYCPNCGQKLDWEEIEWS